MKTKDKRYLKLKYWRQKLYLSQDDMGVMLGCKKACYSKKENGIVNFTLNEAFVIIEKFNKKIVNMGYEPLRIEDLFSN
jgi:DNA-binding XRE family transcriptional regulator